MSDHDSATRPTTRYLAAESPLDGTVLTPTGRSSDLAVLKVASVPTRHVYIRHLSDPDDPEGVVERLPDPPVLGASSPNQWWPPMWLEPEYLRAHHDFDLMHIHFGYDACTVAGLTEVAKILQDLGKPLVLTVHDLRNPHHQDPDLHEAQLGVLVAHADALITLTPGAADEIERRWGRQAEVIEHPHVVDFHRLQRREATEPARSADRTRAEFRVGLHLKSMRACMDPLAVLPTLIDTVAHIPGGVLQVNGHSDVLRPGGERYAAELSAALAQAGDHVETRIHDFMDDDAFCTYLEGLDASVLPYRFGTHSGWLEACRDLGTHVIAPTCGYYDQQGPVQSFRMDEQQLDPGSLAGAVLDAYRAGPAQPVTAATRRVQRRSIASRHHDLYRRLVG